MNRIVPDVTGKHPRVPADKCCLSCYHDNAYSGFNFGVQVHGYVEFAYVADGAVRQHLHAEVEATVRVVVVAA